MMAPDQNFQSDLNISQQIVDEWIENSRGDDYASLMTVIAHELENQRKIGYQQRKRFEFIRNYGASDRTIRRMMKDDPTPEETEETKKTATVSVSVTWVDLVIYLIPAVSTNWLLYRIWRILENG